MAGLYVARQTPEQIARSRNTAALNLAVKQHLPLKVPPLPVTRRDVVPTLDTLVVPAQRHRDVVLDAKGSIWQLGEVRVRGSFGAVRYAKKYDPVVPQLYAVKEVPLEKAQQPSLWGSEVLLQVALRTPVAPHFVLQTQDALLFVMPPLDGDGIDATNLFISKAPRLFGMMVHSMGLQIAEQLANSHAQDIVHLDVKPDNMLCNRDGAMYLTDFGNARRQHMTDQRVGTFGYMAPEVYLRKLYDGRAADVFALGISMLRSLVDWSPVEHDEFCSLLADKHVSAEASKHYVDLAMQDYGPWYRAYARWEGLGRQGPMRFGNVAFDDAFNDARALSPGLFAPIMRMIAPDAAARPSASEVASMLRDVAKRAEGPGTERDRKQFRWVWLSLAKEDGAAFGQALPNAAPLLRRSASADSLRSP